MAAIVCIAAALLLPGSAFAAFPGVNGRIAFAAYHFYTQQCPPGADFTTGDATDEAIFTMNPGGSGTSRVTATQHGRPDCYFGGSDRAYDEVPSFAQSGRRLVFTQSRYIAHTGGSEVDIEVINTDGTGRRVLARLGTNEYPESPAFSPDGQWVAFTDHPAGAPSQTSSISIVRTDGTHSQRVTKETSGEEDLYPTFFPDGKRIAFVSRTAQGWRMFTIRTDGSHRQPLTAEYGRRSSLSEPDVSPDGRRITFGLFIKTPAPQRPNGVFVMSADGTHQRRLGNGFEPVFSPNGHRIAYSSYNSSLPPGKIVVMMADGSRKQVLVPNPLPFGVAAPSDVSITSPSWGPKP